MLKLKFVTKKRKTTSEAESISKRNKFSNKYVWSIILLLINDNIVAQQEEKILVISSSSILLKKSLLKSCGHLFIYEL